MNIRQLYSIILFSLFLTSESAYAKKMFFSIETLIFKSDYIVTGKIISVTDSSYTFKVNNFIKGKKDSIINVQQFENWTCDWRHSKPVIGEELLLFLETNNGLLEIINGSTGERPIDKNKVMLYERLIINDYDSEAYTVDITELSDGIRLFLECYIVKENKNIYQTTIYQKCVTDFIIKKIKDNAFFKWLNHKIRTEYVIK